MSPLTKPNLLVQNMSQNIENTKVNSTLSMNLTGAMNSLFFILFLVNCSAIPIGMTLVINPGSPMKK